MAFPRFTQEARAANLDAADVKEIEDGFARIQVRGARTAEAHLAMIDIGSKLGTSSAGGTGLSPPRQGR